MIGRRGRGRAALRPAAWLLLALVSTPAACNPPQASPDEESLLVAAASDLIYAFAEIADSLHRDSGVRTVFNFGSSGQLAHQIQYGAPFDLFASASARYVDELVASGRIIDGTRQRYARGLIALWTRYESSLEPTSLVEVREPAYARIAIANPAHAPYGVAAREALQSAGLWDALQPRLVFAENIRQALHLAETGNVEVAIVALPLCHGVPGHCSPLPDTLHAPIDQVLGIVEGSPRQDLARRFAEYVRSATGQEILRRHGFAPPLPGSGR